MRRGYLQQPVPDVPGEGRVLTPAEKLERAAWHAADLRIPCPQCQAAAGAECAGLSEGIIHLRRRIKRLAIKRGLVVFD